MEIVALALFSVILSREDGEEPSLVQQGRSFAVYAAQDDRTTGACTLPRFPYRYIGRFGGERDPIAAFACDGGVVTVRRGDSIGAEFYIHAIGIDSVEVGFIDREETLRIPLAAGR